MVVSVLPVFPWLFLDTVYVEYYVPKDFSGWLDVYWLFTILRHVEQFIQFRVLPCALSVMDSNDIGFSLTRYPANGSATSNSWQYLAIATSNYEEWKKSQSTSLCAPFTGTKHSQAEPNDVDFQWWSERMNRSYFEVKDGMRMGPGVEC